MVGYSLTNMNVQLRFITTQQAAKELGYTLQHVRLLIRQGKIRAIKLGRDWVMQPDELKRFRITRMRGGMN